MHTRLEAWFQKLAVMCGLLAAQAILFAPSEARAWGYSEHFELGREAYVEVCAELTGAAGARAPGAWRHFKAALTAVEAARLAVACEQPGSYSQQYGQLVALSGDHLSFEKLSGIDSNIAAKDIIDYLLRASHNAEHFHPDAPLEWRKYHIHALNQAVSAAGVPNYLEQVRLFWKAFYANAYGDHFLEDSFAAGHSGFNRPASTPSASDAFHGRFNRDGKLLRDAAGREWLSFGDAHLNDAHNFEGRRRVLEATQASVRDLIVAFVLGRHSPALERDVRLRVPVMGNPECNEAYNVAHTNAFVVWNAQVDDDFRRAWSAEAGLRGYVTLPVVKAPVGSPPTASCKDYKKDTHRAAQGWSSLLQVQEPAAYVITHTFGVTSFGRINHFDQVLAPTYSFAIYTRKLRFGMDLGWYWSTRSQGNDGALLAPTASFPLGGKYGTVLAWDLDAKFLALLPATSYEGTSFVQHLAVSLGLGVSVQLGRLNLRASAGPSLAFSDQLAVDGDSWRSPGLGWYSQLGLQFIFSPEGGGRLGPPPI